MNIVQVERSCSDGREPLFSFVVVADTHVNETESGGSSPFITNHSANARARYVFQEIAAMHPKPQFVIHLGDIVHPVPSLPTFSAAVEHFQQIAAPLKAQAIPLHLIPGNHDVGDKHIDWMPADLVCDEYLTKYRELFGDDFYSFDRDGRRFLMLNTLLFNSGLADEQRQRDWLSEQIDSAGSQRVFAFLHYPPYIYSPDERGNYDNIDEPARSWLITQLAREPVEAVFAGHVHNFWYDRIGDRAGAEMYMLPSTAFLRHDFAEFYRVAPAVEFARGDPERFGYCWVDVFDDGHVVYMIRTQGAASDALKPLQLRPMLSLTHPKTSSFQRFGVELRHPWAEVSQITATGGVQEFGRKWARNDYPLQALWEMGVRLAKVPDLDLTEPQSIRRMQLLARAGTQFIVTCLGAPNAALLQQDRNAAGVLGFEVNATADTFKKIHAPLAAARQQGSKIFWAKILSGDDSRFDGQHFTHFVKSGFSIAELSTFRDSIAAAITNGTIDGVTVRLDFLEPLPAAAEAIQRAADELNGEILVSLKLAGSGVASEQNDDRYCAARAALAFVLSQLHPRVCYLFDTFMDVDRGYYPRHAFIDRRFAPRAAARAVSLLNTRLSRPQSFSLSHSEHPQVLAFRHGERELQLCCGPADTLHDPLHAAPTAAALDLLSGKTFERAPEALLSWTGSGSDWQALLLSPTEKAT